MKKNLLILLLISTAYANVFIKRIIDCDSKYTEQDKVFMILRRVNNLIRLINNGVGKDDRIVVQKRRKKILESFKHKKVINFIIETFQKNLYSEKFSNEFSYFTNTIEKIKFSKKEKQHLVNKLIHLYLKTNNRSIKRPILCSFQKLATVEIIHFLIKDLKNINSAMNYHKIEHHVLLLIVSFGKKSLSLMKENINSPDFVDAKYAFVLISGWIAMSNNYDCYNESLEVLNILSQDKIISVAKRAKKEIEALKEYQERLKSQQKK